MLLTVHILVGAVIGYKIHNYWLVFILAFLSHFLMDAIPHSEYKIDNLKKKLDGKAVPDLLKGLLDLSIGVTIVLLLVGTSPFLPYIIIGMFSAIIPDGISALSWQIRSAFLQKITHFHRYVIHAKHNENTPLIWGIVIQAIIILLACFGLVL